MKPLKFALNLAAASFILFLYGTPANGASARVQPDHIVAETGIIFSERVSKRNELCDGPTTCWQPGLLEVAQLENNLSSFLYSAEEPVAKRIAENLTAYTRKYFGYVKEGVRRIALIGICSKYVNRTSENFQSVRPPATDLEECYFFARYNVETAKFESLYIDGYSS